MLDAEITGDAHPKTVVIVSDDANAENAKLAGDGEGDLGEFAPDLAQLFADAPMGDDGKLRVELPTDDIGEFIDWVEGEFYGSPAQEKLEAMRQEAYSAAEAAMQQAD